MPKPITFPTKPLLHPKEDEPVQAEEQVEAKQEVQPAKEEPEPLEDFSKDFFEAINPKRGSMLDGRAWNYPYDRVVLRELGEGKFEIEMRSEVGAHVYRFTGEKDANGKLIPKAWIPAENPDFLWQPNKAELKEWESRASSSSASVSADEVVKIYKESLDIIEDEKPAQGASDVQPIIPDEKK